MIRIQSLQVIRQGKTLCRVGALEVGVGERVAVIGPNGCGKSTLLRVLAGLEAPSHGACRIDAPQADRVLVHQTPYLFRGTVLFNTVYGLAARGIPRRRRRDAAMYWLRHFQIEPLAARQVKHLSGGERRRVALARALVLQPRLLLFDEPLGDLDEAGASRLSEAFALLPATTTIVVASPSPHLPGLRVRRHMLGQ